MNTPTPIEAIAGGRGTLIGDTIHWEDGSTHKVLDKNFPVVRRGGVTVQRSWFVRADDGHEGLLLIRATE